MNEFKPFRVPVVQVFFRPLERTLNPVFSLLYGQAPVPALSPWSSNRSALTCLQAAFANTINIGKDRSAYLILTRGQELGLIAMKDAALM